MARRRVRVGAQDLIYAAARARDNAEDLVRAAEAERTPAIADAEQRHQDAQEAERRATAAEATQARIAAAQELEQLRAGQPAAIVEARAGAASAGKALRQALAAVADLEQVAGWRRFTQWTIKLRALNGRARRHFWGPWGEWCQTVGHNQRLWKTALGKYDLARVPLGSSQDEVDQVLLEVMYRAHDLNNGTLSRRADLLRFASLFVLAFVITLGSGYRATSSPTRGG